MTTRILLLTLILAATSITVQAQQCGNQPVEKTRTFGEATEHCGDSIYARQFEYREKRIELREMIEDRRQAYIEPALNAYNSYQSQLDALNARRNTANDLTSK